MYQAVTRDTPLTYTVAADGLVLDSWLAVLNQELPVAPELYCVERRPEPGIHVDVYESGRWGGFRIPSVAEHMSIVLFDGEGVSACEENGIRGGALGSRVGVAVMPGDDVATVVDRVRHELLHTMKLPADHMDRFHPAYLSLVQRVAKIVGRGPSGIQERGEFYSWLEELWLDEVLGRMPKGSLKNRNRDTGGGEE